MPIINQKKWDRWIEKNKDPYGKACVDTARIVMELLDKEKDFDCHDIIIKASQKAKTGGLTGFMAGMVAEMVIIYYSRGEEFRQKWNMTYGIKSKKGIVNPVIMVIKK